MTAFVDTNLLVYARDTSEPEKQPLAIAWMRALWESRMGRLSVQVLEEYYVAVTAKLEPGLSRDEARADVRDLATWRPVELDEALVVSAWDAEDRYGFGFWDSLIVAAAWRAGSRHLLTEDLQDGQELNGLLVLNPFRHGPEVLD